MNHIDDDTLALVALDSVDLSPIDQGHLEHCEACSRELEALRRTVRLGRESQGVTLEQPSVDVWERIRARISDPLDQPRQVPAPVDSSPNPKGSSPNPKGPAGRPLDSTRPRRHRRRVRLALWIPVTAVVAIAAAVGGIVSAPYLHPATVATSTIVEQATLAALPGWSGARGTATLKRSAHGGLTLTVTMTPGSNQPSTVAGPLREVWLMRSDLSGLMSMGFLTSTTGTFAVPAGIDISTYRLVDISAQAADGNPAHSGQSIMRGPLIESQ